MNNVTAQNRALPSNRSQKKNSVAASPLFFFSSFLSLRSLYFPFPCSFLGGFSGSFCLRLLVFFLVKRLQFSFGTFSKIQQDNALTFNFTITYTLISVNVLSSSNILVSLFWIFEAFPTVFFLLKVNGEEWISQKCRVSEQVKLQCLWIWQEWNTSSFEEKCCYLG